MRELKNYNIKNFPVDEYMFENLRKENSLNK